MARRVSGTCSAPFSIPDCICTDTAVASFKVLPPSPSLRSHALSPSRNQHRHRQSPTLLVTETAPPDGMRIGANSDCWVLYRGAFGGNDPPAPQVDSHAALARTMGLPSIVTSQTTRRDETTWRSYCTSCLESRLVKACLPVFASTFSIRRAYTWCNESPHTRCPRTCCIRVCMFQRFDAPWLSLYMRRLFDFRLCHIASTFGSSTMTTTFNFCE